MIIRTLLGVTSTNSSSAMYSTAISRLSSKAGTSFKASSLPRYRILENIWLMLWLVGYTLAGTHQYLNQLILYSTSQ